MIARWTVTDNEEGTVISIDGHPIQFSQILTDEQIANYILSKCEQRKSAERHADSVALGG